MNIIQKGLFVLFFSLLNLQNLHAGSKYFTWLDPQSASRTRIDIASGEVFKEISLGEWQLYFKAQVSPQNVLTLPPTVSNHYFFSTDNSRLFITVDGTGQVYELNFLEKKLLRIDKTFYAGYNFGADVFERHEVIYSIGGVGFWSYSKAITYFDVKSSEWQAIRPKNEGPVSIFDGYQGYSKSADKFYTGGSEEGKYLENHSLSTSKNLYAYDFKTNAWDLLGEINPELLKEPNRELAWNGTYFVQFSREKVYLIDPMKNTVFVYKSNKEQFQGGEYRFVSGDIIYCYWNLDNGPLNKLFIKEIYAKASYLGPFYAPKSYTLYYVFGGLLIVVIAGILYYTKRRKQEKYLSFDSQETAFLKALMSLDSENYLSTVEVNELLGLSGKTLENQRRIRLNTIAQINQRIQLFFHIEKAIERHTSPEDKRLTRYSLNSAALKALKSRF
jgi:hypothetical protein